MIPIQVHNRCIYGSRLYGLERPDSDYDYLYIINDDSIDVALELLLQGRGTLTFANEELGDFEFQNSFFRKRDFLLFFENADENTSICMLTESQYKTLIRANCMWILELLFADDKFKLYPEKHQAEFTLNLEYLRANFKYESEFAIGKGIAFLRDPELIYKGYKNFYYAHRFANTAKQLIQHGRIVDYQEPIRLFYLQEHAKDEAVASLLAYRKTIPELAERLSLEGQPIRVVPTWANHKSINTKGMPRETVVAKFKGLPTLEMSRRKIEITNGVLTKGMLLDCGLGMSYFERLNIHDQTLYHMDAFHSTPSYEV